VPRERGADCQREPRGHSHPRTAPYRAPAPAVILFLFADVLAQSRGEVRRRLEFLRAVERRAQRGLDAAPPVQIGAARRTRLEMTEHFVIRCRGCVL
jgi:hypothetical protein